MSMSKQVYVGNYLKVLSFSDSPFWGFIEQAEDDDIYTQLENNFVSPSIEFDEHFLIIPNMRLSDGIVIDTDGCFEREVAMPETTWSNEWDIVFKELKRQGKEYEMKYGVLIYMVQDKEN